MNHHHRPDRRLGMGFVVDRVGGLRGEARVHLPPTRARAPIASSRRSAHRAAPAKGRRRRCGRQEQPIRARVDWRLRPPRRGARAPSGRCGSGDSPGACSGCGRSKRGARLGRDVTVEAAAAAVAAAADAPAEVEAVRRTDQPASAAAIADVEAAHGLVAWPTRGPACY
eukprot:scaffold2045_cov404-Prasinococcus_capsulatus_cf.AAC.28